MPKKKKGNDLADILAELAQVNREREEKGLLPLTYGKFILYRDGYLKGENPGEQEKRNV